MANFQEAFSILLTLEFSRPSNALHKNPTESTVTYMGIYEKAHPNWIGWQKIHETISNHNNNLNSASEELYNNHQLTLLVENFYKSQFWDVMRLDEVQEQVIANEMFLFAVNAGIKVSIKTAQRVLKIRDDGILGPVTLEELNMVDPVYFDEMFDEFEIKYYDSIIEKNPRLAIYANGWRKRAKRV